MPTKDSAPKPPSPRRYSAASTYEMCRKLIDGGMNVTASFVVVGRETGRSPASVHTAYYTHERRIKSAAPSAGEPKPDAAKRRSRVDSHVRAIQDHIRAQDERIRDLERQLATLSGEAKTLRAKATKYDAMIDASR